MAEGKKPVKISIEEAFRRIRPVFIIMMLFPLFGLIATMILLYVLKVKNLLLMEGLVLFAMFIYVSTTYLVARMMGQLGQKAKPLEPEKEPSATSS
jgi:positive regulator of sigma E activity